MRLAALLARKDLVETVRDRLSFVFILVMPLAFTLFFGILFGANSSTQKLPVAVWDADGGAAAKQLVADLGKSAVVRTVAVNGADLEQQIADDKAAAGLRDPGRLQPGGGGRQAGAAHDRLDAGVRRGGDGGQRDSLARRRAGDGGAGVPCCRGGRVGASDLPGRGGGLRDPGHRRAGEAHRRRGARIAGRQHKGRRGRRRSRPDPERLPPQLPRHGGELHPVQPHDRGHRAHRRAPERHAAAPHDHAASPLGAHRRQGGRHVLSHLRAADPAAGRRAALLRGGLPARPGRAAADDGLALTGGEHAGSAARLGDEERAGAHRHHRARLDGRRGPVRRLVPAGDHRAGVPDRRPPAAHRLDPRRAARDRGARVRRRRRACPRSASRSRGPQGSSCSPSGASASAN